MKMKSLFWDGRIFKLLTVKFQKRNTTDMNDWSAIWITKRNSKLSVTEIPQGMELNHYTSPKLFQKRWATVFHSWNSMPWRSFFEKYFEETLTCKANQLQKWGLLPTCSILVSNQKNFSLITQQGTSVTMLKMLDFFLGMKKNYLGEKTLNSKIRVLWGSNVCNIWNLDLDAGTLH